MRHVVQHEDLGQVELPGDPLRLSRTPGIFSHLPSARVVVPATEIWPKPPRPLPVSATTEPEGAPLAGLRVLVLGVFMAGPFGASVLTDFGADVVKVEGPDGDPFRLMGLSFLVIHKGQRDVVLDIKSDAGRKALADLVRHADVLIDNMRPGVRERIGTDYATLSAVNPRLVRGTVTAWGVGNSLSDTPAFDPLLQARSGLLAAQGGDDAPGTGSMMVHDIGTGLIMAFGLLAALYARDRDGLGQEVVSSMANSSIMEQAGEFVRYARRPQLGQGGRDWVGDAAGHRLYPCRDGWLAVAARTTEQLDGIGPALGYPDLGSDALRDAPAEGDVADRISAALGQRTVAESIEALRVNGVPAAPVLPQGGFLTDPWLATNRTLARIEDPDFGTCTVLRAYANWSGWEGDTQTPAPRPGANTCEVLTEAGLTGERIAALLEAGAARQAVSHATH
jgi:crotonobetainyl-CoA:carnitine CoA-transferase CaiB-like acyl-CoA transferase